MVGFEKHSQNENLYLIRGFNSNEGEYCLAKQRNSMKFHSFQYSWVISLHYFICNFRKKNCCSAKTKESSNSKLSVVSVKWNKNKIVVRCGKVEFFSVLIIYKIYFLLFLLSFQGWCGSLFPIFVHSIVYVFYWGKKSKKLKNKPEPFQNGIKCSILLHRTLRV